MSFIPASFIHSVTYSCVHSLVYLRTKHIDMCVVLVGAVQKGSGVANLILELSGEGEGMLVHLQ